MANDPHGGSAAPLRDKYADEDVAVVWIHGFPARSWEQVAQYLQGDAHDRSKVIVVVGRHHFYPLALEDE